MMAIGHQVLHMHRRGIFFYLTPSVNKLNNLRHLIERNLGLDWEAASRRQNSHLGKNFRQQGLWALLFRNHSKSALVFESASNFFGVKASTDCQLQISIAFFQEDGAPAHADTKVLKWLKSKFVDSLIVKSQRLPRSLDLNPSDFYLWGYLKDKVYALCQKLIAQLKASIEREILNTGISKNDSRLQKMKSSFCQFSKADRISYSHGQKFTYTRFFRVYCQKKQITYFFLSYCKPPHTSPCQKCWFSDIFSVKNNFIITYKVKISNQNFKRKPVNKLYTDTGKS